MRPCIAIIATRPRDIPVLLENKERCLKVLFGSFAGVVFANFLLRAGDTSHAFSFVFKPLAQLQNRSTMPIENYSRQASR